MAVEYATVGLYACSFLPCLSNLSSVILHMLNAVAFVFFDLPIFLQVEQLNKVSEPLALFYKRTIYNIR